MNNDVEIITSEREIPVEKESFHLKKNYSKKNNLIYKKIINDEDIIKLKILLEKEKNINSIMIPTILLNTKNNINNVKIKKSVLIF